MILVWKLAASALVVTTFVAFAAAEMLACCSSLLRSVMAFDLEILQLAEDVPGGHTRYALLFPDPRRRFCRVDRTGPVGCRELRAKRH